jgi:tRNA threonylcarbamoyladenosine dehydratase
MKDTNWLSRTKLLVGSPELDKLIKANILVVGLGGVGSYAAEFLVRAGIGNLTVVDGDVVDPTNRNRQLPALATTHGLYKADVMHERLMSINPELNLTSLKTFLRPEKIDEILDHPYDYVVDAIDSLTPKVTLLEKAYRKKFNLVSSMGAGGKLDPTQIRVVDISETYECNLAFYVRKRLRYKGITKGIKVAFSGEEVIRESLMLTDGSNFKKSAFGTISYLPAAFGGVCASVVIRGIIGKL